MNYETIIYLKEEEIAVIFLNHPPVNSLNRKILDELSKVFSEIEKDNEIKAVIITGKDKFFSAGADISEFKEATKEQVKELVKKGQELFNKIETFDKPTIAAINGAALGGGCELCMSCDLRIAKEGARFSQPEINLGLMPGWGGTQRLPKLIGKTKALEILLTGHIIRADESLNLGLVNKIVPENELLDTAKSYARRLVKQPPIAIKKIKHAVNYGLYNSFSEGLKLEAKYFEDLTQTQDAKEGISAFFEKRKPKFEGK